MPELWLTAFLLTLLIEIPVVTWGLRPECTVLQGVLTGIVLQFATHPLLWLIGPSDDHYWLSLLLSETLVTLAEALLLAVLLRRLAATAPWRRALLISLLANLLSTGLGLLLWLALGRL